jgi:nicotinamide-nucleotide amidase
MKVPPLQQTRESRNMPEQLSKPFGPGDELARQLKEVSDFMRGHSLVLATAESCTAGLIAAHLADVPGAGSLLDCALVAYSPEAKQKLLGVQAKTIEHCNLTSEQVAAEMAYGMLAHSKANLAIANTGVTDDTDPDIPAGTQCFAWLFTQHASGLNTVLTETRRFDGDRHSIREQAAIYALTKIPAKHAWAVKRSF